MSDPSKERIKSYLKKKNDLKVDSSKPVDENVKKGKYLREIKYFRIYLKKVICNRN